MLQRSIKILPWIGAGLLLGLPFVHAWLWWLIFAGAGYFLWILSTYRGSIQGHIFRGWLTGTTQALMVLSWGLSTYPLPWLDNLSPLWAGALIGLYWMVVAITLGSSLALIALAAAFLKQNAWYPLLVPILWIVAELLGAYTYSILLWGAGGGHNLHFSFGTTGYPLLAVRWFDGLIGFGTVYMGTGLVILISALVTTFIYKHQANARRKNIYAYGTTALVMFILLINTLPSHPVTANQKQTVITIDTRFSSALLNSPNGNTIKTTQIQNAVLAARAHNPNIIILPEDSRYTQSSGGVVATKQRLALQADNDVILIDSGRYTNEAEEIVLRSHTFDTNSDDVFIRDKHYLAPQGEFLPYLVAGVLYLLPESDWRTRVFDDLRYRPSEQAIVTASYGRPAVLFCMESVSPWVPRELTNHSSAPFIAHPVSHAWFSDSAVLQLQMRYMLLARAIENNIPIIMAANMTSGYTVMPSGKIIDGTIMQQNKYWTLRLFNL